MCGEGLDGGDAAEVAPVGSIVGYGKGDVVVGRVFPGGKTGTVGEGDVVLREALFGGRRGGDEDDRAGAEAEEEDGTVAVGEAGEVLGEGLLK